MSFRLMPRYQARLPLWRAHQRVRTSGGIFLGDLSGAGVGDALAFGGLLLGQLAGSELAGPMLSGAAFHMAQRLTKAPRKG
jgi:hypothetical protein